MKQITLSILILCIFSSSSYATTDFFTFSENLERYPILINYAQISEQNLSLGDEIGIFAPGDEPGSLICVGADVWTENNPPIAINAWQASPKTSEKNGFYPGDKIYYKIWDSSTNHVYTAQADNYMNGDGSFGTDEYAEINILNGNYFNYQTTDDFYPIIISSANIGGFPLNAGDEIGAFAPDETGEGLICVGSMIWDPGEDHSISAWQDDMETPEKDGYTNGDNIVFRFWDQEKAIESTPSTNYLTGNGYFGTGFYSNVELSYDVPIIQIQPNATQAFTIPNVSITAHFSILNIGTNPLTFSSFSSSDDFITIDVDANNLNNGDVRNGDLTINSPDFIPGNTYMATISVETNAYGASTTSFPVYVNTSTCPDGNILYVDQNSTGNQDGSSWEKAFVHLEDALQMSQLCDNVNQVWIAQGSYTPTQSADRSLSFQMFNDLEIYGGFNGTESQLSQRSLSDNPTALSGDIGIESEISDNSYHVVNASNTNNTAILDGLTITQGNANFGVSRTSNAGGGLQNIAGSPIIQNCQFINNIATTGGAIYTEGDNTILKNCSFSGNIAMYGNGIALQNSQIKIESCSFTNNNSDAPTSFGGALYSEDSDLSISRTHFYGNSAIQKGGAIAAYFTSLKICNTTINGNASDYGGGIYIQNGALSLSNSVFSGNIVDGDGGAINNVNSNVHTANCSFSNNEAALRGGGFFNESNATCNVHNSILWNNKANGIITGNTQIFNFGDTFTDVDYSIISGGWIEGNNWNTNPLFEDADGLDDILGTLDDNLILLEGSPAIDVGKNDLILSDFTDLDEDSNLNEPTPFDLADTLRIQGGTIDLGAYESTGSPIPLILVEPAGLLDFGGVEFDGAKTEVINIANIGSGALSITLNLDDLNEKYSLDIINTSFTIYPNESIEIPITFTPNESFSTTNTYHATLQINSNALEQEIVEIPLKAGITPRITLAENNFPHWVINDGDTNTTGTANLAIVDIEGLAANEIYYYQARLYRDDTNYSAYTYNESSDQWISTAETDTTLFPTIALLSRISFDNFEIFYKSIHDSMPDEKIGDDWKFSVNIRQQGAEFWSPDLDSLINLGSPTTSNEDFDMGWITGFLEDSTAVGGSRAPMRRARAGLSASPLNALYMTEFNGIIEGYPDTDGYFRLAVPAGTQMNEIEFRQPDNSIIAQINVSDDPTFSVEANETVETETFIFGGDIYIEDGYFAIGEPDTAFIGFDDVGLQFIHVEMAVSYNSDFLTINNVSILPEYENSLSLNWMNTDNGLSIVMDCTSAACPILTGQVLQLDVVVNDLIPITTTTTLSIEQLTTTTESSNIILGRGHGEFCFINRLPDIITTPTIIQESLLEGETNTQDITIIGTGETSAEFTIDIPGVNWLSIAPQAGNLAGCETLTATLTFDASQNAAGIYQANLLITGINYDQTDTVYVQLEIEQAQIAHPTILDIQKMIDIFGSQKDIDPEYEAKYDENRDKIIDMEDLKMIIMRWGE